MSDDEFGDCTFLGALDVEPAIALSAHVKPNDDSASKRRKVSLSPAAATVSNVVTNESVSDWVINLQTTLKQYFGYDTFREGQLEVVLQLLQHKRDMAVFWATGQGKSLCYQIPALALHNKIAVVVSPLISLMQDQVHKLNGLAAITTTDGASSSLSSSSDGLATFLGSGQTDATAEPRALNGEYRLIYVTPEKLLSGSFLDHLARLHGHKQIAVFAIDEAHCVSEWGFDFRPEFRQVGNALRGHSVLSAVPILALTATAVPRVQQDICDSLQLRNPFVAKQSFDRTNLKIRVLKKNGIASAMKELLAELNAPVVRASKQSTIVYAPTRSQVDEVASYLKANVHKADVRVEAYHAGLSNDERGRAHTNFLTGVTTVIVATVAFGMGIDKPDTRRVIHFGCPKTLEEYYQQIGRAGRDGLPAECVMYVAESDFDRYKSDFYLGGLTGKARQATEASMAALRSYSFNGEICRRKALLNYFQEVPAFGERCGTCDTCLNVLTYGTDAQRDFGSLGAKIVLQAIDSLKDQGMSTIVKVISGSVVDGYRYKHSDPLTVQALIQSSKKQLAKQYPQEYYRDLIGPLTQKGYLTESTKASNQIGFNRSWTTYQLSFLGQRALSQSLPILLPVPESVRRIEQQEEEKRQKVLAQLEQHGIATDKLPREEIERGDGEVIRSYTKWYNYLEQIKKSGRDDRVAQLESLLAVLENWRSETAIKQRMAPASVLAEHRLYAVAYTVATLPPGLVLQADALQAAGVRTREIGALVTQLGWWVDEAQPAPAAATALTGSTADAPMILAEFLANQSWQYAVYKPQKKGGLAAWEYSYVRFEKGESPMTIAVTPTNGRPIQVKTVVGHILDALIHGAGRRVDLRRLVEYMPPPTQNEWRKLQNAEATTNMDVTGDPDTSGRNGQKFLATDILRPIVGDRVADLSFTERSEDEKQEFSAWCDRLKWYMALRRAGYEPNFDP